MNTNKKIAIIGVALIVIVVCVIFASHMNQNTNGNQVNIVTTSTVPLATSTATSTTGQSSSSKGGSSGLTETFTPAVTSYINSSFSFNYPSTWEINSSEPVSIDNFNGAYQNNDIIPMGGAEIDFATTTTFGTVQDIMGTELLSVTNLATSTVLVNGISCIKAKYNNTYAKGISSDNIAVYCLRGSNLLKIYLSYRAGDPDAQSHVSVFNSVLSSTRFKL